MIKYNIYFNKFNKRYYQISLVQPVSRPVQNIEPFYTILGGRMIHIVLRLYQMIPE